MVPVHAPSNHASYLCGMLCGDAPLLLLQLLQQPRGKVHLTNICVHARVSSPHQRQIIRRRDRCGRPWVVVGTDTQWLPVYPHRAASTSKEHGTPASP